MFKTCPRCGDEFLPHVSECPDCHVPLRHAEAGPPQPAARERAAAPGPLTSAVLLRRGEVRELRELTERLSAAGIACAVDTDPPGAGISMSKDLAQRRGSYGRAVRLGLYVSEGDLALARPVLEAWTAEGIPDAEAAAPIGALSDCPGCGEPLAEGASACASCGLEFPDQETLCSGCGQPVAPDAQRCPHCGERA